MDGDQKAEQEQCGSCRKEEEEQADARTDQTQAVARGRTARTEVSLQYHATSCASVLGLGLGFSKRFHFQIHV
jgi:hypothetical protein